MKVFAVVGPTRARQRFAAPLTVIGGIDIILELVGDDRALVFVVALVTEDGFGFHGIDLRQGRRNLPRRYSVSTGVNHKLTLNTSVVQPVSRMNMPSHKLPIVTAALILANLLVYSLELAGGGYAVCEAYGLVPARFMSSGAIGPVFSSMFLHDPERLAHIGGNMAFLAVFGAIVEGRIGHRGFLGLYVAAGVFGALLHILVDPAAVDPLVGASGALFGVMAVAAVVRPRLLGFVVAFAGIEVWRAFDGADTSVSFGCHLGGLFAGFIFAAISRALGNDTLEAA